MEQQPSHKTLQYNKLNDRETEIVKNQVKMQYNSLKFRKYASLAHLNPSSGAYKDKLTALYNAEVDLERLFNIYVYNLLRPDDLIKAEEVGANPDDVLFQQNLRIGILADRLQDSLWHTNKRLQEATKLMKNSLELLEDQIVSADDKALVKITIIEMINYVCETKKALLTKALEEDDAPMFDLSALNPFNTPVKIKLVQDDVPIPVKMFNNSINGGAQKRQKYIRRTKKRRS